MSSSPLVTPTPMRFGPSRLPADCGCDETSELLQLAHSIVLLQCPNIFLHSRRGYDVGGRGALLVRFESVDDLRAFNAGKKNDGGVEESKGDDAKKNTDEFLNVNYFDIFTLGHLRSAEVNECVTKYDPCTSFVLITSVVTADRRLGFSVSVSPADAPARLLLEIVARETLGIGAAKRLEDEQKKKQKRRARKGKAKKC